MAKQYYIKKNPSVDGPSVEWIAINGKEFYQLITSPAGKGRYFIDMDDFMIGQAKRSIWIGARRKIIKTICLYRNPVFKRCPCTVICLPNTAIARESSLMKQQIPKNSPLNLSSRKRCSQRSVLLMQKAIN